MCKREPPASTPTPASVAQTAPRPASGGLLGPGEADYPLHSPRRVFRSTALLCPPVNGPTCVQVSPLANFSLVALTRMAFLYADPGKARRPEQVKACPQGVPRSSWCEQPGRQRTTLPCIRASSLGVAASVVSAQVPLCMPGCGRVSKGQWEHERPGSRHTFPQR